MIFCTCSEKNHAIAFFHKIKNFYLVVPDFHSYTTWKIDVMPPGNTPLAETAYVPDK